MLGIALAEDGHGLAQTNCWLRNTGIFLRRNYLSVLGLSERTSNNNDGNTSTTCINKRTANIHAVGSNLWLKARTQTTRTHVR